MRFNVNRLSVLAGLPAETSQRLAEASNASLRDDPALKGEAEHRFGDNQLAEGEGDDNCDEVVYEVDAKELKLELARLRLNTLKNKKKSLQEASLKRIIEQEVKNVFKELEDGELDLNISAGWVYGKNKPRLSLQGQIVRGFKSIGFK